MDTAILIDTIFSNVLGNLFFKKLLILFLVCF